MERIVARIGNHERDGIKQAQRRGRDYTPREMLATPVFWVMYVMFVLVGAGGLMATAQLGITAKYLESHGLVVTVCGDGKFYYSSILLFQINDPSAGDSALAVSVGTINGANLIWSNPFQAQHSTNDFLDKEWLAIDPTSASPSKARTPLARMALLTS